MRGPTACPKRWSWTAARNPPPAPPRPPRVLVAPLVAAPARRARRRGGDQRAACRYVVVVDLLPGGLQIEDGGLATRWQQADEAKGVQVNFVEKLDDRLLLYCDLLGQAEARFTYQARAVTRGRFVTPRITAEAMYSPEIAAASGDLSDFVVY